MYENSCMSVCLIALHVLSYQALAPRGGRRQLTAAQELEKKYHDEYFRCMREIAHEKKVQQVHQLEVMWEAEDRVEKKRVTRILREEEEEQRIEDSMKRVRQLQLETRNSSFIILGISNSSIRCIFIQKSIPQSLRCLVPELKWQGR